MPATKGSYGLLLHLPGYSRIRVGTLGTFSFPNGHYVYLGSALGGLESRIARHLRKEKRLWWHIDYFVQRAQVVEVFWVEEERRLECSWAADIAKQAGTTVVAPGFGSSDCKCPAHLLYLGQPLTLPGLRRILGTPLLTAPTS